MPVKETDNIDSLYHGRTIIMKLKKLYIVFAILIFSGCGMVSLEEHRKGGIGMSIEEFREIAVMPESYASRIGWKETTYKLNNGNLVYVEPEPRHYIHWEVNPQGVIVGSRVEKTSSSP